MVDTPELEDQDQAEVLDETHLTRDGEDIANFDTIPDVIDVTAVVGDAGEDDEADDGIETDQDVEEGEDEDLSPRTRLEDRPDNETVAPGARASTEDLVLDDEEDRPSGLEGGTDQTET
jgi:hypothetical protein